MISTYHSILKKSKEYTVNDKEDLIGQHTQKLLLTVLFKKKMIDTIFLGVITRSVAYIPSSSRSIMLA